MEPLGDVLDRLSILFVPGVLERSGQGCGDGNIGEGQGGADDKLSSVLLDLFVEDTGGLLDVVESSVMDRFDSRDDAIEREQICFDGWLEEGGGPFDPLVDEGVFEGVGSIEA